MSNNIIEELYINKEQEYFSLEREIFKNNILANDLRILDIGCGTGNLGEYFIKNQNCEVYGVEINKHAFSQAKLKLSKVVNDNIETVNLDFKLNSFDFIILGDVIEHLINPNKVIIKLLPFLKNNGTIIITTPNVRHWSVSFKLIFKDNWDYKAWGILDFTHLRFFTKTSFINILESLNISNFEVEWSLQKPSKSSIFNFLTFGIFKGFLASHLLIKIKK